MATLWRINRDLPLALDVDLELVWYDSWTSPFGCDPCTTPRPARPAASAWVSGRRS